MHIELLDDAKHVVSSMPGLSKTVPLTGITGQTVSTPSFFCAMYIFSTGVILFRFLFRFRPILL